MNLKSNSWHAKLYRLNFEYELPQSLCPYFWKTVASLATLPVNWFLQFGDGPRAMNFGSKTMLGVMTNLLFGIMVYIIKDVNPDLSWALSIIAALGAILVVVLGVLLIIGIVYVSVISAEAVTDYLRRRRFKSSNSDEPIKTNMLKEWWKGFTGKYCPKIDWK
jgi:hypothetical protein